MRCMATVLMGVLVLLILVPAVMQAVSISVPPFRGHTNVAYVSPYDTVEPSASASRMPLPSGTGDLIAIAAYAVFGAVLLGLLLITLFVVALLRRRPITRSRQVRGQMEVEETRVMQEIYRSLGKMESRIEALETLLLERPRTGEYSEAVGRGTHRP